MNLHKTLYSTAADNLAGPIGVAKHLEPPLQIMFGLNQVQKRHGRGVTSGECGILPISWMYIKIWC